MKHIAKDAGVSQTTVSFVLNDNREVSISDETKNRVLLSAQKLGYKHRLTSTRSEAAARPPVIGFLIDEISTSIFGSISIDGAQQSAWNSGYLLQFANSHNDRTYENEILSRWLDEGVEGIIYGSILTRQVTPPSLLKSTQSVLLNCYTNSGEYTSIVPSELIGGFTATEALIESGCKRIAHISGEEWMEATLHRSNGYRNALASHGIEIDDSLIKKGNFLPSGGYHATKELLNTESRPDAIFCANDQMAIGAYEAIKEAGLSIPKDISIVGYDDQEVAGHLNPPLSTVLLPHREMGRWAVEMLLASQHSQQRTRSIRLECPLIPRQSIRETLCK